LRETTTIVAEPISTADSSYPQSIRASLAQLQPGTLSPIIALDSGYAILLLEAIIPADQPPADAREKARSEVTLRAQRVAMERLSRELLNASNVTAFDESLRWSWETRPNR
jgi:parvulin-like peptidyl-prolyl isomerase